MVAELDICHVSMGGINTFSVADPDPGSGAFLTPGSGSGILNRFFPDPGSQTHIFFRELSDKFWVKSSIIL
jgi:hypothetical protein